MGQFFTAFGLDWKLLLIQGLNFGVLLIALTYLLYKPILRIIDERREKIADGVRTAQMAAQKLEEAKAQGDGMIADAARQAEGLVGTARARASELSAEALKETEAKARALLKEAQARAEEDKRRAMKESEREIVRAALLAAEKILGEKRA
ncbi:MAG TPA: ATP synthase F0 subunit B [Candidatus Paceibacterota bacterium]|nr:ATP synthase F0 subunit B [Candidatus Paceibacterota bacterium]